jgi:hypothetical protein
MLWWRNMACIQVWSVSTSVPIHSTARWKWGFGSMSSRGRKSVRWYSVLAATLAACRPGTGPGTFTFMCAQTCTATKKYCCVPTVCYSTLFPYVLHVCTGTCIRSLTARKTCRMWHASNSVREDISRDISYTSTVHVLGRN